MRRFVLSVLGGVAVVLLAGQLALAQDAPADPSAPPPPRRERWEQGREQRHEHRMDRLVEELGVEEETATKVRELFEQFRKDTRDWQRENGSKLRELFEQSWKAREAGEEDKLAELTEQIDALRKARLAIRDKLLADLSEILTDQQMETVKDVVIEWRARLRWMTHRMELTDDQQAALNEVLKSWNGEAEDLASPEERHKVFEALVEKVITDVVLTAEQREALAAIEGDAPLPEKVSQLDLTDAQKAQMDRLREALERGRGFHGGGGRRPGSRPGGPGGGRREGGPGPGPQEPGPGPQGPGPGPEGPPE